DQVQEEHRLRCAKRQKYPTKVISPIHIAEGPKKRLRDQWQAEDEVGPGGAERGDDAEQLFVGHSANALREHGETRERLSLAFVAENGRGGKGELHADEDDHEPENTDAKILPGRRPAKLLRPAARHQQRQAVDDELDPDPEL